MHSINQKMKDQTNDLVDLICVNKIENGLQMLSLEARIMIMDFKMAAREIVNSCRLGVLVGLRPYSEIYQKFRILVKLLYHCVQDHK